MQKYFAELLATFIFTLAILSNFLSPSPVAPYLLAALVVGTFVYTIGSISGAHLNPAVTVAVLVLKKIKPKEALWYIVAQFVGALAAMLIAKQFLGLIYQSDVIPFSWMSLSAEVLGAFILMFGISSVVIGKVKAEVSGLVIGGSLLLALIATGAMGNSILNPAIAVGIGSLSLVNMLAPVVGTVLGALAYSKLK